MALVPTVPAWTTTPYGAVAAARLADELKVGPATASILARRGLAEPAQARAFLAADRHTDPFDLHGVSTACDLVLEHMRKGSRIAVFGDYDVDGVCSTALMVGALRALGADPTWLLPSRAEGYGLSGDAVRRLAAAGTRLLVTVDCGVTAVEEVALAQSLGLEVLVTDHHRPGGTLPDCTIVHPGLAEEAGEELCAAGVALKLSEALRTRAGHDPRDADVDLDLAGLATVCDMVPLVGENRRIAREGLAELARTSRPGLRALMRVARLEPGDVDARAAGFRLGPRLNAAGRMGRADAALELMLTEDDIRAEEIARELDGLNHDRREAEVRILAAAEAACTTQMSSAAIVVAGEGWHPGVAGIVASRLVEAHRRPCVVIALEGDRGRGSGRSIPPYDLHEGLRDAAGHLLGFGGHRMAAGLEIEAARVADLRRALAAHASERLAPADLQPVENVDAVIPVGALTLELAEELQALAPFGMGNPEPTLLVPSARIEHVTAMGEEREHARFSLAGGGARARGVAFRVPQAALAAKGTQPHDVAVTLERHRWNGTLEARVQLRSLCPTPAGTLSRTQADDFWTDLDRQLAADPARWWASAEVDALARRPLCDRRSDGFAGVAVDLLTSGERVLLVVADIERRRRSLEAVVAGHSDGPLATVSWQALALDSSGAATFDHLLALDPPPIDAGLNLLRSVPGEGLAHLAWGEQECGFALAHWRSQLALRPALVECWRTLSTAQQWPTQKLQPALQGAGPYPRDGALCGRLLRVLHEIDLVDYDPGARSCRILTGRRTDLGRSPAYRAYAERFAAAEVYLSGPALRSRVGEAATVTGEPLADAG
jgi:single-stranded-DNA-specific exonuclease